MMEMKTFIFGNYEPSETVQASAKVPAVRVGAGARYDEEAGFGFIDEKTRREQERLQLPELNSGFEPVWWYQDEELINIQESEAGCSIAPCAVSGEWEKTGRLLPLLFKADMKEEGSYRLNITVCNHKEYSAKVVLFAGRRHLVWKGELAAHEERSFEALINVSAIVPRGKTERYGDTTVDVALVGDAALAALTIRPEKCPVVYIAGDSTVTDQSAEYPYTPGTSYSGWGQMLAYFLPGKAAVSNHAHSGLTTESFRQEGHYAIVEEKLRAGDYVLIQFAHNDQKLSHLLAEGGYRDNLLRYIREIREKGAQPILITPIARNSWKGDDNSYNDFLAEYAKTVLAVGAEQSAGDFKVPVIDLHKESMEFILRTGLEQAKAWFYPADYTHSNDFGAFRAAKAIAEGLKEICPELFAGNSAADECWEPEGALELPICPERMKDKKNPVEEEGLLQEVERPEDMITRAEILPMLIQALKFFPTNVYNDMYSDVIGHEWYAGAVECAWQNGIIPEEMTKDGRYHPDQELSLEELMAMTMNGFRGRKQIHAENSGEEKPELIGRTADFARKAMLEALSLGILSEDENLERTVTRGEAADMIRSLAL